MHYLKNNSCLSNVKCDCIKDSKYALTFWLGIMDMIITITIIIRVGGKY